MTAPLVRWLHDWNQILLGATKIIVSQADQSTALTVADADEPFTVTVGGESPTTVTV